MESFPKFIDEDVFQISPNASKNSLMICTLREGDTKLSMKRFPKFINEGVTKIQLQYRKSQF